MCGDKTLPCKGEVPFSEKKKKLTLVFLERMPQNTQTNG